MAICRSCGESEAATGICLRCWASKPGTSPQPAAHSPITDRPESPDLAGAALVEAEIAKPRAKDAEPAKGGEEEKGKEDEEEEEEENFRRMFSARLIRPNRLNSPSKLLMWLAVSQIAVVAVLMAVQKVRQPQVSSTVLDPVGGDFAVPLVVFVVMSVSVAAGYWFGLAGALRVRASVGVPVAALVTWTLTDYQGSGVFRECRISG